MGQVKFRAIEGSGNHIDRSQDLLQAIYAALDEKAEGMTFTAILGCLELVKASVIREAIDE